MSATPCTTFKSYNYSVTLCKHFNVLPVFYVDMKKNWKYYSIMNTRASYHSQECVTHYKISGFVLEIEYRFNKINNVSTALLKVRHIISR